MLVWATIVVAKVWRRFVEPQPAQAGALLGRVVAAAQRAAVEVAAAATGEDGPVEVGRVRAKVPQGVDDLGGERDRADLAGLRQRDLVTGPRASHSQDLVFEIDIAPGQRDDLADP